MEVIIQPCLVIKNEQTDCSYYRVTLFRYSNDHGVTTYWNREELIKLRAAIGDLMHRECIEDG